MKYFIVTGGSRGVGESIIRNLFNENHQVLCVSRTINDDLVQEATMKKLPTTFESFDLNEVNHITDFMRRWKTSVDKNNIEGIYLINNAGIINPIKPIFDCHSEELIKNVQINLIAPMILQSEFIKICHELVGVNNQLIEQRILNISSGAATRAIQGWSSYCTSKAGLDMFSSCVEEDLKEVGSSIKVVSLAPGIVDTNMQKEIRASKESEFSLVKDFKEYKKNGQLLKPNYVGQKLVEFLFSKDFGKETITRIDRI